MAEGYLPARLYGVRPGRKDTVVLTLRRPGAVEGRVVGPGGRPVETFSIRPWMKFGSLLCEPLPEKTLHDRGGRFHLGGLSRGTYTLSVKAEGLAERRIEGLKVEPGRTLALPSPIRLQAGSVVEGSLADPRGRPCPAVRIVLSPAGSPRFRPPIFSFPPLETFTGPDGRFRVEEVPPGRWKISARGGPRGWAEREEPIQTGPDRIEEDLRLRLLPPASLEGQVYDPRGRPAKGADLRLSRMEGTFLSRAARTDSRGRFFLAGLPPGKWYLTVLDRPTLRGGVLAREELLKKGELPREILYPRMRSAQVELAPGEKGKITLGAPSSALGALEGRVTSGGRPIEGAKVMILSMDPAHRFTSAPPRRSSRTMRGGSRWRDFPGANT